MKSFELAVNIERVIRSLKNTWTIIKPPWGQGLQPGGKGATQKLSAKRGRGERRMQKETEGRMQRRRGGGGGGGGGTGVERREGETTGSGHR